MANPNPDTHAHAGAPNPDDHVPHVVPIRAYVAVGAALFVLTVVTVAASRVDFGAMNLVIALLIATIKASLVALVFMHLLFDNKFNSLMLIVGLLFLALFIGFSRMDVFSRGRAVPIEAVRPESPSDPFASDPYAPKAAPKPAAPAPAHGAAPAAAH